MEGLQQGYNPIIAGAYGAQFGQGLYGGGYAPPLGGLMGSGIPGLLSQNIGRQQVPGQPTDGIGGIFQSYAAIDPMNGIGVQQAQQAQLLQQAQNQLAQQVQLAQLAQQLQLAQLAQQAQQQGSLGRWSPFGSQQPPFGAGPLTQAGRVDPITAAYIQQAQIAHLYQQLAQQAQLSQQAQFGHPFGHQGQYGQSQFGPGQIGQGWLGAQNPLQNLWQNPQFAGSQFGRTLPFQTIPLQAGQFQTGTMGVY
jgi:hypothetical protein